MKQRENSAAGMVVGMAAGAALGAAGAMMATQSKRQMRRNVRKVMKGAENAVMQLDKMAPILWKSTSTAEQQKAPSRVERRFLLSCGLFCPDAHPGGGVDLAQQAQIHLDIAGHGQRFAHLAAGQH